MKPRLSTALAGLLLLAAPLALWSQGGADRGWTAVNRALVEGHLIPRYRLLAQETAILDAHLGRLCDRPSETGLTLVRRAFVAALDAWSGISHIRFGPVETEQRWYRFQLWPDKRGTGQRQIRKFLADRDQTLLEPEVLARQSVAVQGLGTLELLLFPEDQVGLSDLLDAEGASYRCRLARAIGHNLAGMAGAIIGDWTEGDPPFRRVLLDPPVTGQAGPGAPPPPFADARSVSAELLRTLATGVQVIHDLKLSGPLGPSAEGSQPRKAESWRSRRSLDNVCTGLRALDHLYATGFSLVLRESRDTAPLDLEVGRDWAEAIAACLGLPGTLLDEEMPSHEQRQALERLRGLVLGLRARTGAPLAEALELSLGFNSLDGD